MPQTPLPETDYRSQDLRNPHRPRLVLYGRRAINPADRVLVRFVEFGANV